MTRTYVATRDTMFELATCAGVRWRFALITWVICQGVRGSTYAKSGSRSYKWGKSVPSPECNYKAKPGEEEHPAINVPQIEYGNRSSLAVGGVDLWGSPEI
jgi:hypothetical protein